MMRVVLVDRDGAVDAVADGVSSHWIGLDLADAGILARDQRDRFLEWLEGPATRDYAAVGRFITTDAELLVVVCVDAVPVRRTPCAPRELLRRAIDTFVEQARTEHVDLRVIIADDLPATVELDREKVTWVLATLIGNALRVLSRSRREGEGKIELSVSFDAEAAQLVMAVRDDGPGMPPEIALHLFDPDPRTGRTAGLALLLVRDVLAAHGGSIAVASDVGQGATFTLRLPARA